MERGRGRRVASVGTWGLHGQKGATSEERMEVVNTELCDLMDSKDINEVGDGLREHASKVACC